MKCISLWVEDARKSYDETTKRGAKSAFEPKIISDDNGEVVLSAIHTYGETLHVFVERHNYTGVFMPGYRALTTEYAPSETGLLFIDHMVGNGDWGQMNKWVDF